MPMKVHKEIYEEMVNNNIKFLEKHLPPNSLEKGHIILILRESVKLNYPETSNS
jgi:hypothetical protein